MLDQLNYRFISYEKEMDRRARLQGFHGVNPEDARKEMADVNERTVNRLKIELELHEESSIADLRAAVRRLTDK